MPRVRSPNRDKAFEIYLEHGGNITNRAIAELLNEDEKVIAVWKSRDKWSKVVQQSNERCTTKRKGGQPGNKNATGGPIGNKKAEKHGFFSKYLPEETMEIFDAIETRSPIDILWDQIRLQYAAITRSQKIMYVRDQEDKTIEKVEDRDGEKAWGEKWEVQHAWDKQANFLQAQSRAMTALNTMIKQYEELLKSDLATEEQRLRIDKLKVDISKAKGEDNQEELDKLDKVLAEIKGVI